MNWTPDDWERLGAHIRTEREIRGFSRDKLAELACASPKSIQNAEAGRVPTRWPTTFGRIESALMWLDGSFRDILDGGEPSALPVSEPQSVAERVGVTIPAALYADLIAVAAHVSAGRSAAFVQQRPYPDALARRTLGALDDAGLLPTPTPPAPEES